MEKVGAVLKDETAPLVKRIHALWALMPQPGGLTEISPGLQPGVPNEKAPSPGGAKELTVATRGSAALAGADPVSAQNPGLKPGANIFQPSGLAARIIADALHDKSPTIRAQAARAIGLWQKSDQIYEITKLVRDSSAAVRLEAVLALGRMEIGGVNEVHPLTSLRDALDDKEPWLRFAAIAAAKRQGYGFNLNDQSDRVREAAWSVLSGGFLEHTVETFAQIAESSVDLGYRQLALTELGHIAYQPKPYDGKWWGTQPVKNPPPPHSVARAGTPSALAALTAALADADPGVRRAAAQAFAGFTLDDAGKPAGAALRARLSTETAATPSRR